LAGQLIVDPLGGQLSTTLLVDSLEVFMAMERRFSAKSLEWDSVPQESLEVIHLAPVPKFPTFCPNQPTFRAVQTDVIRGIDTDVSTQC
jgi:hypothetical protein